MKIIINPEYAQYGRLIRQIPNDNYRLDQVYCDRRNLVGRKDIDGKSFVIKRYKRPTLVNCVVYTWFRTNKAQRAYQNAFLLLERGIETARPVAYITRKKHGFFHTGYFVAEYLPYIPLARMNKIIKGEAERRQLASDYIEFTLNQHRKNIILKDNNAGNTLVYKQQGHYRFALVDINRISTGHKPNVKEVMRSFDQLGLGQCDIAMLVAQYVAERGLNPDESMFFLLLSRRMRHRKSRWHRVVRRVAHAAKRLCKHTDKA